ncbi:MAG: diguanylate cyclase [Deltaproteobacteria bacterium]|nr:diguanylate cyclase [Deltaproteobacteria bacterium]
MNHPDLDNQNRSGNETIDYTKERILVVDDEEAIREITMEMLINMGFSAEAVRSGEAALKALEAASYTFLLTDIKMPGIDGLELIRRIKDQYPQICAIAMTGYSKEYNYVDVVDAGAADFINKPFRIEELIAKIRRAIMERNIREKLSRLSITDALTGLYNHRHFYDSLEREILRAKRQNSGLAVIMFDLDGFKGYNDEHGHRAGDNLLKCVGDNLRKNIREGVDAGFRYGGDEFAVILIEADEAIARKMAERIEKTVQQECDIGMSSGFAVFSQQTTGEELVELADRRLYTEKAAKI